MLPSGEELPLKNKLTKIGFGGGCHWCTEAIFQSLIGVVEVAQGFVASTGNDDSFSEAVIVHFDPKIISLKDLTEIHLHTHKSTQEHSMRKKYRSAIYTFDTNQKKEAEKLLKKFQKDFQGNLITKVLPFEHFKFSDQMFHNYYYTNPEKPFCETYINPKISLLLNKFSAVVNQQKTNILRPIK